MGGCCRCGCHEKREGEGLGYTVVRPFCSLKPRKFYHYRIIAFFFFFLSRSTVSSGSLTRWTSATKGRWLAIHDRHHDLLNSQPPEPKREERTTICGLHLRLHSNPPLRPDLYCGAVLRSLALSLFLDEIHCFARTPFFGADFPRPINNPLITLLVCIWSSLGPRIPQYRHNV